MVMLRNCSGTRSSRRKHSIDNANLPGLFKYDVRLSTQLCIPQWNVNGNTLRSRSGSVNLANSSRLYQQSDNQIRGILNGTAIDLGTAGWDKYYGYGKVDAYNSVSYVLQPPVPEHVTGVLVAVGISAILLMRRFN